MSQKEELKVNESKLGTFEQWYKVYKEEGYEPEKAEELAFRSQLCSQHLPNWYLEQYPNEEYLDATAEAEVIASNSAYNQPKTITTSDPDDYPF